ncbi:MAG: carbohydrate-binding family 9-like protein [Acidobacteriaceae bacterium]|nr:carbohydrate-binding family 9-like protein [Acidobacteriaceae bacterium]
MKPDYIARRAEARPSLNGKLDHSSWQRAEKSPRFVDMASGEPGFYDTRAAVLWDDEFLYVGFWAEEPFVRANLTERDSLIFLENDLELFIDGDDSYYEFEVNALGTIYEVFFIWKDAYANFDTSEWNLENRNVLSFAGNDDRNAETFWRGTHPRGPRWAFLDWDLPGLKCAVHVDGRINDDSVVDRGWTVEVAIPWAGMKPLANNRPLPPRDGDVWRMFFGRFEKLRVAGVEVQPHPAWAWTPHGVYDTHRPECFTRVQFSNEVAE